MLSIAILLASRAFDAHGLWVANYDDSRLRRLDAGSGRVLE
jgi:hypothetical protein